MACSSVRPASRSNTFGRCTRILARLYWFAGEGGRARETAREAIAILERLGESGELARAYSANSQLAMLAQDVEGAVEWGERALDLAVRLGAEPLAARLRARLRACGVQRVPRGPRADTRANPAGLTARQLDVLALLREGLTDAEIAQRLVVSVKTVNHHVSAVLNKLGVDNRRAAVRALPIQSDNDADAGTALVQ